MEYEYLQSLQRHHHLLRRLFYYFKKIKLFFLMKKIDNKQIVSSRHFVVDLDRMGILSKLNITNGTEIAQGIVNVIVLSFAARYCYRICLPFFTGRNVLTSPENVIVAGMPHLPQFCHATISDDTMYISGCIGLNGDEMALVEGGVEAETTAAMEYVRRIMQSNGRKCKLLKVNIYLKDNTKERFMDMNSGYSRFFEMTGWEYCARITVGCGGLALGAQVEVDAVAKIL
jgi:2-iminobutanoate/2-iminopropanoate deaminase